ncbi:hypothetical protein CXB51_008806 [Gossypium anomalum]|uniref:RING-type E3 ubiquitin transferase n=1 Tax=Gossypium anomalum TaxID=47600 RepID=A0A8J6DAV9_9ROSI|nr:hypothetical protein CXB51_008806 [Gossypium anomalum]
MREALFGIFSLLFIAYFSELASSTIVFKPLSISLPDLPAKFAIGNNTGVCGALEVADPLDACSPLRNVFGSNQSDSIRLALIIRGDCSFEEKIRNAQNKGFSAAIVYDDKYSNNLVYMMVNPKGIKVLAVFVSKSAGEFLKDHAKGENGECCIYPPLNGKAWTVFAICFLSLVVIAAFLVIAFVAPRSLSNWQRRNLVRSVDSKMVDALPRFVFGSARSSIAGETCAICLEDYNDGELLKVLPCQHDFHSSCVESWLTKWGTFCPVCKLNMTTKFAFSEKSVRVITSNDICTNINSLSRIRELCKFPYGENQAGQPSVDSIIEHDLLAWSSNLVCRFLLAMAIPIRSVFLHPSSLQNHAQNIWETLMQPFNVWPLYLLPSLRHQIDLLALWCIIFNRKGQKPNSLPCMNDVLVHVYFLI